MKIALDHDETYTADPEMWYMFVALAKSRGHEVAFVTYRMEGWDNDDIEANAKKLDIPIVYTNMKQKKHCYQADIWIDDSPEMCASYADLQLTIKGCDNTDDKGVIA